MRNETDRDRIMRQGREALKMLDKDKNWTWWRTVGEALITLRHEAMDEAMTNRIEGGAYNRAFGRKLREERLEFDGGDRKRLFDCMDNLPAIEAWRATLSLTERRKLNHPSTVWRKWQATTKVPEPRPTPAGADARPSLAALEEELAQARAHIADLEASRGEASQSEDKDKERCSFCGKPEMLCLLLIAGRYNKDMLICDECAYVCAQMAADKRAEEATKRKARRSHAPAVGP
jgi:hypothetical protein